MNESVETMLESQGKELHRMQATQDALRALFATVFRFEVGDVVVPRAHALSLHAELEANGGELRYGERWKVITGNTILERRLVQCHGGVQGFYAVQRLDNEGREIAVQWADHQVVSYDEAIAPVLAAAKAQREKRAEESAANPTLRRRADSTP